MTRLFITVLKKSKRDTNVRFSRILKGFCVKMASGAGYRVLSGDTRVRPQGFGARTAESASFPFALPFTLLLLLSPGPE